jgi:hypothetical protein
MFLYHTVVIASVHMCLHAVYIVSKCLQVENVSLIVAGNHILTLVMMLILMKYNTRPARPHTCTLALIQHVAGKERLEVRCPG